MRFQNRVEAGRVLATKLSAYTNQQDAVVLALPRGGVPVAFEVATALNLPLDVLPVRKLGVPGFEELGMGAIASGGFRVINEEVVRSHRITSESIDRVAYREQQELERRERVYRHNRPPVDAFGSTVILVDDGMATGCTMHAAVVALRQQQPTKIIVASPIGDPEICARFRLEVEVNRVICAKAPVPFYAVGYWYENFPQVTDKEVTQLLEQAGLGQPATCSMRC